MVWSASSLPKTLSLLSIYSVAISFYCSKYTSELEFKFKFSNNVLLLTINNNNPLGLLVYCNKIFIIFLVWQSCTSLSKLSFFQRLNVGHALLAVVLRPVYVSNQYIVNHAHVSVIF